MELINGISMIPFGLLAGFADDKEIRITELAENGFKYRTVENKPDVRKFKICFYDDRNAEYHEITVKDFRLKKEKSEKFYYTYTVFTEQENFRQEVKGLVTRYSRYIRLKMEENDGELAKKLTGYPAEKDEIFAESLSQQKREWFRNVPIEELKKVLNEIPEFALELDRSELYAQYLKQDICGFMKNYWVENGFQQSVPGVIPDRLYIGNQFCHLLFPEKDRLFLIMEKALQENKKITLAFTYIRENMLKMTENLLEEVYNWCKERQVSAEIVINDWAMVEMLKKYWPRLTPCLGTLLNKRRKDPRIAYKKGNWAFYEKNSLNAEFYKEFLEQNCNILRIEWESCGYMQEFPKGKNSLHFPFYQTNTSQFCPLHAICVAGDRGKQGLIKTCPCFCEQNALLYPVHLNMTGRYNSLFGVDVNILHHPEMLKRYEKYGIDRLVLGL